VSTAIAEIEAILAETEEADDALRRVTAALVEHHGATWAAIAFREDERLTVGPEAGAPRDSTQTCVEIAFNGDLVGELQVEGSLDRAFLELVADRLGPYALIGWDTGGQDWIP
jgi:putative methionine-R-sulfoxide reductase with GAF domain